MRKFLLIIIGLMVYGTIVFGQATATLRAGSTDLTGITPGTKIYLPIVVDAISANLVTGYQFFIDYDHSVMSWDGTITNPTPGVSYWNPNFTNFPGDYLFNDNGTAIIVSYVDGTYNGKVINPGEIFITFKFTYLGGQTDLIWETIEDGINGKSGKYITEMYDENFDFYTLTLINGCVCLPNFDVTFHATEGGIDLPGADVTIDAQTITTDANGNAVFNLADGDYSYSVTKTGYYDVTGDITVAGANQTVEVPMSLFGTEFAVTFQVTSGGNPLQNAKVMAGGKTAFTNAAGEAILSLANGDFNYNISKYGFTTETGPFTVAGEPLTIPVSLTMLPHYDIVFHITSGGIDLGGALVNIPDVGSNLTGANGEAMFSMVDGNYSYTVSKAGYANSTGTFVVAGSSMVMEVSLLQLFNTTFHVTNGTANIAGASVTVGTETKTTNASGIAVFSLPDGDYTYLVTKLDYNDETGPFTVAGAIQTIEVTMTLVTYPVTFHVTSGGIDIEGALITVDTYTGLTNTSGIAILDLPNGSYFYEISKLGFYNEVGNFDVSGGPVNVNVTLNPFFFEVIFHVTSNGNNLSGAEVTIGSLSITTNSVGNAEFSLINGTYDYTVTKPGYDTESGTFTVDNAGLTIQVPMNITVWATTFHVTSDGADLEGALVAVGSLTATTNASGIAVFDLPDGPYTYTITKTNYETQTGSFTVAGATQTIAVDMPFITWVVTFHIVSTNGALEGVAVTCNGETVITNASGNAVFNLPNGIYPYTAVKAGYITLTGSITVNNANQTKNLIMFPAFWPVTFTVTAGGSPVEGAEVILDDTTQITPENGIVVFQKINGSYTWTVSHPDYVTQTGTIIVNNAVVNKPVVLTVGVEEISSASFNIYPNPSTGTFNLSTSVMGYESDVTVYDLAGKLVYSGKMEGNDVNVIDLTDQQKGMYFLQIIVDNKVFNKTLVIQ